MDAKKIWSYARRLLAIIPSIFICALGVALLVWPEWGCDPLTTFEIGLSNVFHVQFGTVALVFEGIMFFVFFFVRRDLVHLGTLAWCFLIGPFENFWLDVLAPMLPTAPEMSVGLKIACILIGSIIIILTLAYYIPIGLGYQTSDIFAFMAADLVKKSYGIGLIISYAILFVIGVALGSSWGIDPKTGYPVQHNILSATVLAKNCATADAYATSFMVMGMEGAKQILKKHPDLCAYLIYADEKGQNKIWYSSSLKNKILNK